MWCHCLLRSVLVYPAGATLATRRSSQPMDKEEEENLAVEIAAKELGE